MKNKINLEIFAFIIINLSIFLYYNVSNIASAVIFIVTSFIIAYKYRKIYNNLINSKTIFSFIYFFTIGLSMLQLHQYQTNWKLMTFIILEISYFSFMLGFNYKKEKKELEDDKDDNFSYYQAKFLMNSIFWLSLIAFFIEFIIRGYIPIFESDMAAYQNFSVTGIHYFTVSSALYLPMAYYSTKKYKYSKKEKIKLIVKSIVSILIPILIVSRQLLLMELILTFFIAIKYSQKKSLLSLIVIVFIGFIAWKFVGNFRNQDNQYLKNALEIQEDAPLSVSGMNIYMYVAFNYDNFNANVDNIENYTYGYQSLFFVLALTGTKFFINNYININHIRVVDVFNTYPIQMTPYSDFGLIGVVIYMFVIGMICKYIEQKKDNLKNIMYKCIIWYCLLFSFFTSFFSNASIIFMCVIIFLLSKIKVGGKNEENNSINVNI